MPSFFDEPNPDRFHDYYTYIHDKSRRLRVLAEDTEHRDPEWLMAVSLTRELLEEEIADALGKWPWIKIKLRKRGWD